MEIFKKTQRFNQWWLIAFQLLVFVGVLIDFIKKIQLVNHGDQSISFISHFLDLFMVVLFFYFINTIKLRIQMNEKGIAYQFFPIHLNYKKIFWKDLSKYYVRNYSPITEYGGWGIRGLSRRKLFGFGNNGKVYNIKGNIGIQLEFKDGGKLLLGRQKGDKFSQVITSCSDKMNSISY